MGEDERMGWKPDADLSHTALKFGSEWRKAFTIPRESAPTLTHSFKEGEQRDSQRRKVLTFFTSRPPLFWKFLVNAFHQKKEEGRKKTRETENGNAHNERQRPWFPEWRPVQGHPSSRGQLPECGQARQGQGDTDSHPWMKLTA